MKYNLSQLDKLFSEIKNTGTEIVKVKFLNLHPNVKSRMNKFFKDEIKEIQDLYKKSQGEKYMEDFKEAIYKLLRKNKLKLNHTGIVHHKAL